MTTNGIIASTRIENSENLPNNEQLAQMKITTDAEKAAADLIQAKLDKKARRLKRRESKYKKRVEKKNLINCRSKSYLKMKR